MAISSYRLTVGCFNPLGLALLYPSYIIGFIIISQWRLISVKITIDTKLQKPIQKPIALLVLFKLKIRNPWLKESWSSFWKYIFCNQSMKLLNEESATKFTQKVPSSQRIILTNSSWRANISIGQSLFAYIFYQRIPI